MQPESAGIIFKSESIYRMLLENSSNIIFSLDMEGTFTYVSPAWERILGHVPTAVVGHHYREFVHPEDVPRCEQSIVVAIQTQSEQELAYRIQHADGSWNWHSSRGASYRDENGALVFIGIAQDITERLRIEEIMNQSEKMIMISSMAAGMAHEINNPLGAILQHAQNIERRVLPDIPANLKAAAEIGVDLEQVRAYMQKRGILDFIRHIRTAGVRASDIITNMLHFSRRSEFGVEYMDLATLLDRVLELAGTDYDMKKRYGFARIELQRDYAAGLPPVPVVSAEMEQVLLNIIKNAVQAMAAAPHHRQPQITLRTRLSKGMALIEIEDNGPGMNESTRLRVFEPFFSTKEVGVGTGMGLSVAYAIVTKGHSGMLEVRSRPDEGSCFTIKLPLPGRAE